MKYDFGYKEFVVKNCNTALPDKSKRIGPYSTRAVILNEPQLVLGERRI